jgi:DNA-binding PadR family transcriptional regulator
VVIMTGTYAMGAPWAAFAGAHCGPAFTHQLRGWLAAMTGRHAFRGVHGFGPLGGFAGPSPFGPPPGPPWAGGNRPWGRPTKARRGDVRAAILAVLAEQPRNGYQIISEIAERSGGAWKPSPGSIYPNLQQLEDEGLITADTDTGRRTFRLTDAGRTYVAEHPDEVSEPWAAMSEAYADDGGLRPLLGQVAAAFWQIGAVGTPEQQARARDALSELRRTLYQILADDSDGSDDSDGGPQ